MIKAAADAAIQLARFDRTLVLVGLREESCGGPGCDALPAWSFVDAALAANLRRLRVNGVVLQRSDHEPAIGSSAVMQPKAAHERRFSVDTPGVIAHPLREPYSNAKMRFQSFFMSTTIQWLVTAASRALSRRPKDVSRS